MNLTGNKKGLALTAGSILVLAFLFLLPYHKMIIGIPSPEFESVRRFYWWLILAGCGFLFCLGAVLWISKKLYSWIYPVVLVILGVFYLVALPPFTAPDEAVHFVSAYRLSSTLIGKPAVADQDFLENSTKEEKDRINQGANVLVRDGDDVYGFESEPGQFAYNKVFTQFFSKDSSQGLTVRSEVPVNTFPVVYLPQAIGIALARVFHMGYVPMVMIGRLFNLLAFTAMSYFAYRIMPFKKEVIMAVSALPMTLHLAASYSYDSSFIGLSMMFVAWCFYLAFEKDKITIKDVVILALLLILLEPGKIVYLPLAGICLFIPSAKFQSKKQYWISFVCVLGGMLLAVFLVNKLVLSIWSTRTESYVGWSEAAGYTLSDVLSRPYDIVMVYYKTFVTQLDYYLVTMLGGFLGNLDPNLTVPPFCLLLLCYGLFVSVVRREGEEVPFKSWQKWFTLLLVFLSACLVLASMLLGYTPREMDYIVGIQGRYFIPLLPLVLLPIFDKRLVLKVDLRKSAWFLQCFVSIYALIRICSTACLHY
jgi:uncharacterized membrane protein